MGAQKMWVGKDAVVRGPSGKILTDGQPWKGQSNGQTPANVTSTTSDGDEKLLYWKENSALSLLRLSLLLVDPHCLLPYSRCK